MSSNDMDGQPASTRPELRVSSVDRDRVAHLLGEAAAEERLSLDELKQRLDVVYAATTAADLESITYDLPSPVTPHDRIGGRPGSRVSIGTMSLTRRNGAWVVPPVHTTVAFWGGTQLDLSHARFAEQHTVIRAFAYLGAVEIIAPDDITVHMEGVGLLGSFYGDAPGEGPQGSPVVRITGVAVWGTVRLTRKG